MPLKANSLYIILFYLRTTDGEYKYHWVLHLTGSTPPSGVLCHATDAKAPVGNLYRESYPTKSGMLKSRTVVVALYVGSMEKTHFETMNQDTVTHLMDPKFLPNSEPRWTCRVWVKTVLSKAQAKNYIKLPASLDNIELCALATADRHMGTMGTAQPYDDLGWLQNKRRITAKTNGASRTVPMDIDSTSSRRTTPMSGISYHNTVRPTGTKPMQGIEYQSGTRSGH